MSFIAKMIAIAKSVVNNALHPAPTVILPETELTVSPDGDGSAFMYSSPLPASPEIGKTYEVTYNGTEYDCPAVEHEEDGVAFVGLGNTELWGASGSNAEAPFVLMFYPAEAISEGAPPLVCVSTDSATSVTLSIVEKVETASAGGGIFYVTGTASEDMTSATLDQTNAEIMAAISAGQYCVCNLTAFAGTTFYLPMAQTQNGTIAFGINLNGTSVVLAVLEDDTVQLEVGSGS